jgi:hypothetical protein
MERDKFNPYKFESSEDKPEDKKEDDKKKTKSASGLGKLLARQESPKEDEKVVEKGERSFLQKLAGEAVTSRTEQATESVEDSTETGQEVPLEGLSRAELTETAQAYIAERAKSLTTEADDGEFDSELAVQTDADAAFLAALHDRLGEAEQASDLDEIIEKAYDDVVGELGGKEANVTTVSQEASPLGPQDLDPDEAVALTAGGARLRGNGGGGGLPSTLGGTSAGEPRQPASGAVGSRAGTVERYSEADVQIFERRALGRGVLVGGIIGYLIGRRRGRIKTEKRLKVVQQKLEKQVEQVQTKIEQKEWAIRTLAREQSIQQSERSPRPKQETSRERPIVASGAERAITSSQPETVSPVAEATNAAVESLSKEELLAYSGQIRVGETSLRRVYEAKMVDEKGLRRLIKEYQAGHDLRRALAREFMVKELKFERDPTLRDLLPPEVQPRERGKASSRAHQYDNDGAAPVAVAPAATQPEHVAATPNTNANAAKTTNLPVRKSNETSVSPGVLVGLTLLTIGLAIYAIWLTVTK